MIESPYESRFGFRYSNIGNASSSPGTSVTPGASNAEGSWTQVATSGNISEEIWEIVIGVTAGSSNAQAKNHLLDVGIDEAGGSSYTAIISNIVCGQSGTITAGCGGIWFRFPIKIKSGSSVAVRIQGSNATAGTVRVIVHFYGKPSRPEVVWRGEVSETIGTITNSNGVSFTPGNAAEGTWVSLGTTSKKLSWWQLGVQVDNSATSALVVYVDLAYGDSTNKHMICEDLQFMIIGSSEIVCYHTNLSMWQTCFCEVPSGGELWVRGMASAAPTSGYNAVAVGVG